jgi:protocatechuate 3,4-dioxygenase beta subunit
VSGVCLSLALVGDTGRTGQAVNTRDDGSFSFRVEPGIYTMDVSATGAPPGATYQFDADVDLSSGLTGQTIMLPSPVALKFAVQDPWGQPVAGATVRFSGDDQVVFDATAVDQVLGGIALSGTAWGRECVSGTWTTDASGDATQLLFPGTPNGPFDIRVTPPAGSGLVTSFVSYDTPLTADTTIPVTLSAGSVFSGMVQDASGNPLPNVVVELGAQNGDIVSMQTGDDGAFSFGVEPGVYSLHLWSQQGSPSPLVGVDEQNSSWQFASSVDLTNSLTDQTITLPPVVTVKVRVHDSSGNPVTGATVDCAAWWESVAADQTFAGIAVPGTAQANEYFDLAAATDSSGSATMRVFPGTPLQPYFQVLVTPAAGTGMAPTIVPYDMPITGDTTIPVTVSSLSGTLETATGQPLPGQGVALQTDDSTAAKTTTGSGGAFALTAPPATYSVALSGAIGDPTRYEVTVPGVDLTSGKTGTFKLPTHTLAIVVTGQAGKPLSHATVLCAKTATSFALFGGTARGSQSASAETNTAGKVSLQLLPARLLNLTVTLRTGHGRSSATKTVAASASAVCFRLAGLPRIGSSGKASAIVGRRLHFQVAASGSPAPIFSESGALPKGMKLSRTGLLHGTPSPHTSGTYRITVTAANRVGSAGQLFVLTVR